jgi:hypothetical protein
MRILIAFSKIMEHLQLFSFYIRDVEASIGQELTLFLTPSQKSQTSPPLLA